MRDLCSLSDTGTKGGLVSLMDLNDGLSVPNSLGVTSSNGALRVGPKFARDGPGNPLKVPHAGPLQWF